MLLNKAIIDRLGHTMWEKRHNQMEVAAAFGTRNSTICRYLKGQVEFVNDTMAPKLAEYLGLDLVDLYKMSLGIPVDDSGRDPFDRVAEWIRARPEKQEMYWTFLKGLGYGAETK